ncbi:hypothetical protein [Hymenobacter mucosus]|uniref:Uncharacterized protein n=1 Tax=Hymenobacter mucosus TaxID=1411120 RepID=A0A239AA64_9BACT|nr:hypothetical protein [Hymenobacter mucosus]SNR91773.1 hypothetical protein SAMN06269173_11152 [Hymenobacter mucosus]
MNMLSTSSKPLTTVAPRFACTTTPAPQIKPQRVDTLSETQGRRLLLNQLLITHLESNTQRLLDEGVWPSKEDKLVNALGHRIGELYERYYKRNGAEEVDWLNNIIGLSEGATISILALAIDGNPIKTQRLSQLLIQLAQLAGTYSED